MFIFKQTREPLPQQFTRHVPNLVLLAVEACSWLRWDWRLSRNYQCETTCAEATLYLFRPCSGQR